MEITIVFTTQLKAALGSGQLTLSIDKDTTVRQVIESVAADHPDAFSRLVFDSDGNLLSSILLCVNDQQVDADRSEPLADGDTLTLLSAISGG